MKTIQQGHVYQLDNKIDGYQTLRFFKDEPRGALDNHDGVLCQEVLRALIDRVLFLNACAPCHENVTILDSLRAALIAFESRASRRSLEHSYNKTGLHVEQLPTNDRGHVFDFARPTPERPANERDQ